MSPNEKPWISIEHTLPGRVRVRLSAVPRDAREMADAIMGHAGMTSVDVTPVTRSLLVLYDSGEVVLEEIVMRIALSFSLDRGTVPVRVLAGGEKPALADSAVLSAALLGVSLASRLTSWRLSGSAPLDQAAGIGTAAAVLDHGWRELRERGYFDPEVLSLGYLLTAFVRGDFLRSSVVTWLLTFGRHLMDVPRAGVEIRPLKVEGDKDSAPHYEIVVGPDVDMPSRNRLLGAFKAVIKYAVTGGAAGGRSNLLDEFRDVSEVHGEVLEGLGRMSHGIPVRFR